MNNCSPWIHEIYQGIFEICTDLGILVVNAKYAQKYTVAYTRFFAQCTFLVDDLLLLLNGLPLHPEGTTVKAALIALSAHIYACIMKSFLVF